MGTFEAGIAGDQRITAYAVPFLDPGGSAVTWPRPMPKESLGASSLRISG